MSDREASIVVLDRPPRSRPRLLRRVALNVGNGSMDQVLAEAIQKNGLGKAPLSAVVEARHYQLVQLEAPDVQPQEWRAAIRWRLRDVIDFPLDAATVDIFEIPEPARGAQAKLLYAVAARNEGVARVRDLLAPYARGFDTIDIPELCLRNLAALLPEAAKGVALLLLGEQCHHLVLVRGEILYVTRRIDWRGRAEMGFSIGGSSSAHDAEAGALALELQRSLDYFESHFDQSPIGDMVVAGPQAVTMTDALRREIGLRVRLLDLTECLDVTEDVPAPTDTLALLATGAALRCAAERA